MLWYYFTIVYYVEGEYKTQSTSYSVAAASRVIAWNKVSAYAMALYGRCLCKVELHTVSTY